MLACEGPLQSLFDQPLARPGDRIDTGLQGRRNLAVAPPFTLGEASAFNRMRAFNSFCAGCFPLWIRVVSCFRSAALSVTMYFFLPSPVKAGWVGKFLMCSRRAGILRWS